MSIITKLKAREIIDSRGNPTIEVLCELAGGFVGKAAIPSGASTGSHEALELRDLDPKRFAGLGVLKAVANVNGEIHKKVSATDFDQVSLDQFLITLDGTKNKSRLGANAVLGVSVAFAKASALEKGMELFEYFGSLIGSSSFTLPQPMFNIINGGMHADSGLDIQEFMIGPIGITGFDKKIQAASEIIHCLKDILHTRGYSVGVGDEGGFAPKLSSNEEALDFILRAIKDAGYSQKEIKIGMDAAASSFYKDGYYDVKIGGMRKKVKSPELLQWYKKLVETYPLVSIEDGFDEEDWEGFRSMMETMGDWLEVVGDDLTVTNTKRIDMAIRAKAINSVLIKPNQIGTVSETVEAVALTTAQGWKPFASHRSGETADTFIADLAVGLSCGYIKAGSLVRGERVCKYNRLLEISATLGV